MSVADKIRLRLPDSILWLSLIMLVVLTPVVLYMTQSQSVVQLLETRDRLNEHRELMNSMRREAALLSSGHRNDPGETLLESIRLYHDSAEQIAHSLTLYGNELSDVLPLWQRYQKHHQDFHTLIQQISSYSSAHTRLLLQSEEIFQQAKGQLKNSLFSPTEIYEYQLILSEIFLYSFRFSALPDGDAATSLYSYIDIVRTAPFITDHAEASRIFSPVLAYEGQVRESVRNIHMAVGELMSLPAYYVFEQFETAFEHQIDSQYREESRYLLLTVKMVVVLSFIIVIVTWHLRKSKKTLERLNTQLEGFKSALDEHAIVSITDKKGVITYVNKKFTEISGYQSKELIGRTHRLVNSGIHPKSFFASLWKSVHRNEVWHGDVCNVAKTGEHYWVHATVMPVFNQFEELESIISVRTDITRQKQIETELLAEKEKAEEASRAKSGFLANMSHEIRTPMNAVIGMSHLALQHSDDPGVKGYIDNIQTAAQNLLGIINDILDFSKIEAGKLEVEQAAYRLDNVLNNLASVVEVKASEKGLPVVFNVADDVPLSLEGDALRLGQVLLNLVNNAIKFTNTGEIRVDVSLISQKDEQVSLRFAVTDTGIGLSKKQQQMLFQAFSQADISTTRQYGGTGLGLAISKQLTELMGGQIGVFSEPGEGSEFFFTIQNKRHQRVEAEHADLNAIRVLYIDDDPIALSSVLELCASEGIEAEGESNSPDGLNHLVNTSLSDQAEFDVVMVDWQMPMLDGFQVAQSIRNNPALAKQPAIILITSHNDESLQSRVNSKLFDAVLLKPVSGEQLVESLKEVLTKRSKCSVRSSVGFTQGDDQHISSRAGARVLIAEDNKINQEVIQGLMAPFNMDITLVSNGLELVQAVQHAQFDLILTDIQMPELDGMEATRQILAMPLPKPPPVIAMTAHAMTEDIRRCHEAGMSDHISKPIDPDRLKDVLVRWIEPRVIVGVFSDSTGTNASQTELPDKIEHLDMLQALRSTAGNKALLKKLLLQFVKDYQVSETRLADMIQQKDWKTLTIWLHTLKGASATLGADRVAEITGEMELRFQSDGTLPPDATEELLFALNQLLEAIHQCTGKLPDEQEVSEQSDQAFVNSLQPSSVSSLPVAEIQQLSDKVGPMLDEGDAEVLDLVPELLELCQQDEALMNLAAKILDDVESFEFEAASEHLKELEQNLLN